MNARLIAIDLDGTLFAPGGTVSAANVRAIEAARTAGHRVVIATGRSWLESREAREALAKSFGEGDVLIGAGGAVLSDFRSGRTLERRTLDVDLSTAVARCMLDHGHPAQLLQDPDPTDLDYLLVGEDLDPTVMWWLDRYRQRTRASKDVPAPAELGHTVRVGTVLAASRIGEVARQLREDLGDRLVMHHWRAVAPTPDHPDPPELVEAFAPRTSKWTQIERLCAKWEIDPEDTVAIGDGLNDLEMVASAGVGIAMGNADPRVVAVAKRTTGSNRDDGVAQALAAIVDGRW
jgi:hydroxymethylpyrimidine pyrophosphatase-like HAD family hydrolase